MATICREIIEEATIHANGDVVCSCQDAAGVQVCGNVNDQDLYTIFHGEKYQMLRSMLGQSTDTTYCPTHGIHCPFKNTHHDPADGPPTPTRIRKIRLETISHCNLRCPSCIVTDWYEQPDTDKGPHSRFKRLPLEVSQRVLDEVGDSLEQLWLYNYGEPFLDRHLLDVCRHARKSSPNVFIYTHTNATVVPEGWPEAIMRERLFNSMSFSIDGATQESFEKYRVRGDFGVALETMREFARQRDAHNRHDDIRLVWQYILFEWNDSPEELRRAQELAAEIGVEIQWIVTHTAGKSQRILADSPDYEELIGVHHYSGKMLALRHDERVDVAPENASANQ